MNFLQKTLKELGFSAVGREVGLSRTAISFWFANGKLPDTEYLPKHMDSSTDYAGKIASMAKCKKADLL